MTKDEKGYIVGLLVPKPMYRGCWYDDSIVWLDERPFPTQEEINQRYMEEADKEEKALNNKMAAEAYYAALNEGYEHTDGNTYYCDERATNDMVKALSLFSIDTEEPLLIIDMNGTVHELYINDFKALAAAIGRYQYTLRQTYWSSLR